MNPVSISVKQLLFFLINPASTSTMSKRLVPKSHVPWICVLCMYQVCIVLYAQCCTSASDWCALQEALYKCIDTIHVRSGQDEIHEQNLWDILVEIIIRNILQEFLYNSVLWHFRGASAGYLLVFACYGLNSSISAIARQMLLVR